MKAYFIVFLILFQIQCLKPKKSIFDFNSPGTQVLSNLLAIPFIPPSTTTPAPIIPVVPAPTQAPVPVNTLPTTLSYTGATQGAYKVFQGNQVNFTPTMNQGAVVQSWSITPDISTVIPGLVFNPQTGAITGAPTNPPGANDTFPSFTITAITSTFTKDFPITLQLLGRGGNVWTVINGVNGGDTKAGINSMKYNISCNCLVIAGSTNTNMDGQIIPSTGGNSSGYISKYDLDGKRIWTSVIGVSGGSGTGIDGLVFDMTGNIYIAGFHGAGNFHGCVTSAPYAGFIAKFNSNGTLQWTTCTGIAHRHYYTGVVIDNNGDIIGGGTTYDNGIDGMSHTSASDPAVILQKFDPTTGNRITGSIVPGNGSLGTDGYGVAIDSTGKVYVAGAGRASSYCGSGTPTYWRPVLFRFNSSLAYIGCAFIPVSITTFAFGVTTTPTGESFVSGYANHTGSVDGIGNLGTADGYITKFNNIGTKLWTKRLGVTGAITVVNSVEHDSISNNIFIAGKTSGNLGGIISGQEDMFVAKYDIDGNQPVTAPPTYWTKLQGITGSIGTCAAQDCKSSIAFDSNKTMYSFTDTNGTFGNQTNPASPNRSMFLVRNVQ